MTYQEYCQKANAQFINAEGTLRLGQSYMNLLYEVRPELEQRICGTDLDPFYKDDNLYHFLEFVKSEW